MEELVRAPHISIVELVKRPEMYDGQTVRLQGVVKRAGDTAIVVQGQGVLWAARIPVISSTASGFERFVAEDEQVEVTGIATARATPDILRNRGGEVAELIGDGPFVVARSIRRKQ